jgi:imidazolonepropionase-like amidohydrolase
MTTLLTHLTLFDGTGREPIREAAVMLDGERIAYAGPATGLTSPHPVSSLDLRGAFVMPGLIDAHVHLALSGEPDSHFPGSDGEAALAILKNAQRNLAAGFTSLRDLGGWNELEFAVRRSIQRGLFAGPRLCLAGRFISITESGVDYYRGMYAVVDGSAAMLAAVREQIKNGADLVKLGVTGAVLVEDGVPGATHLNPDEIATAVAEAAKFGRRVSAHAHGADGIRKAVEAGVHTIEHGTFLHRDPETIRLMAGRGVFLVPTLSAGWAILSGDATAVPDWIIEKSRPIQEDSLLSLRMAYEVGVPIANGSDAATPLNYHGDNAREIHWMQQAGLPALAALHAATGNAARALGWDDRLGTLQAGKLADLIVLEGDPLDDLRLLADKKSLRWVMKGGRIVARHLDEELPRGLLEPNALTIGLGSP